MDILTYNMELADDGLYCISLVDEPAIETDFLILSKELVLALANDEKRLIKGAALIPNVPIYRNGKDGQPYYAHFSEETVKNAAIDFLNRGDKTFSVMHDGTAIKCKVVESFILEADSTELDAPKGSWIVTLRVDDESAWEGVKKKLIKGFSIEGAFIKKEVLSLEQETMNEEQAKKLDLLLELLQKLVDAVTNAPEAPADAPVGEQQMAAADDEEKEAIKAENETLKASIEALKSEITKMQEEKIQSVKLAIDKSAGEGFRRFSETFSKIKF
jgi:hypothetical protein